MQIRPEEGPSMKLLVSVVLLLLVAIIGPSLGAVTSRPAEDDPLSGWRPLWTREAAAGQVAVDEQVLRDDKPSIRIEHRGQKDWALVRQQGMPVKEGDILEMSAWVKTDGEGAVHIGATTHDPAGKVLEWMLGEQSLQGSHDWRRLRSRMVVPAGVADVEPRIIGHDPATVWVQGFSCWKTSDIASLRGRDLPQRLTIENAAISVTLDTRDATLQVKDLRNKQVWMQKAIRHDTVVLDAKANKTSLAIRLHHVASAMDIQATLQFGENASEFTLSLAADGDLPAPLAWPAPFVTGEGTYLVVPMNEGISYPVDDESIEPMRLVGYGGHGICMSFWGVTDGRKGQMAILETPDDAAIQIGRADGNLYIRPEWESQKGRFGYTRRIRYIFLEHGGYVAMCKRYRAYAQKTGLLKTLAQKRDTNRNVDMLAGAVNVWCWEKDPLLVVADMKEAGIDRILWSNQAKPEDIAAMNRGGGVLTSRYDIYQDVMDPATFKELAWIHPDWPQDAWPKDIILDEAGNWIKGWEVEGKDQKMHPCGVTCDRRAIAYAKKRIPAELKDHAYRSRFIDTATAANWRECYSPDHPMTRTESRFWRMELLRYVSQENKLVTGSETGHDAAVPYLHYFEGMMSLGPYRCPDAGRNMQKLLEEVPAEVKKFQVGWQYRLPLWELVYHDCVVSYWYWGDYSNKAPAIWDERDLFNALYGTPAMFMFDWKHWREHRSRFVQSYRNACTVAKTTTYAEMTDHRFLTADRSVQQSVFANGVGVIVNFGVEAYKTPNGPVVPPLCARVTGPAGTKEQMLQAGER